MNYKEFLISKSHTEGNHGIKSKFMPAGLFDYQKYVVEKAVEKGRCALFLDTGLGKTAITLTIAHNYVQSTNKPVLIITPLAVAHQFIKESHKFGIGEAEYSKDGKYKSKIVICNYERLEHFTPGDFDCVILDESSILKNFDGSRKTQITAFLKKVKYRYLATATPSPNDFIELGTSSEALGYMGYMDMLTKFFKNNEDTISPVNIGTKWVLKGHAQDAFFKWVSGWSITMRRPSDYGFSDEKHKLPELVINQNFIQNDKNLEIDGQLMLMAVPAQRLTEVRAEQRITVDQRAEKAVELAKGKEFTVYWTNLNDEADLIEQLDPDAVQIKGSMSIDKKEDILLNFSEGNIKKLVTKTKITAFGLNWQHCNHTVYFPTFSYEQYYQAVRRFYRFGQKKPVTVDMVVSDGQQKVINALIEKTRKADELFEKLKNNINSNLDIAIRNFDKKTKLPGFLGGNK